MKRHPGLVALLLLPAVSWAQPSRSAADATDIETPPPGYQVKGVSPNLLKDYLAAVQAVGCRNGPPLILTGRRTATRDKWRFGGRIDVEAASHRAFFSVVPA